uniref:GST N-terminal domain-containing protein n=1 Tax=Glossina pallidipes TaxID=7398 RepID=A0A1A9ZIT2_GLOPL
MGDMSGPWPHDAVLYQPFEDEQILLAEKASCSAVKAYLKMCNLPYDVQFRANAEFMSPGGHMTKLPVLKVGGFVLAEFEPIVNFVEQRSESISRWMMEDEKTEMRSYICTIENTFTLAEMYCSFMLKGVYNDVTAPRNGCVFPWPLNKIQNLSKRYQAEKMLKVYQWTNMTFGDVLEEVSTCCRNLEMKLEESLGPYFYGERPCELDALVFGHLFSILTTNLPNNVYFLLFSFSGPNEVMLQRTTGTSSVSLQRVFARCRTRNEHTIPFLTLNT